MPIPPPKPKPTGPHPATLGPYTYDYGMDYYGHPPNGFGRCEFRNTTQCPPLPPDEVAFLETKELEWLVTYAEGMFLSDITIPDGSTKEQVIQLIIEVLYPDTGKANNGNRSRTGKR